MTPARTWLRRALGALAACALWLGGLSGAAAQPGPGDVSPASSAGSSGGAGSASGSSAAIEPVSGTAPIAPGELPAEAGDADAEVIEISDQAPAESASSVHLSRDDLASRSRTQVSDILRQVPGLMVSQHAGGGKSDQYFIRGFDADHGTDLAIYADGVPVNLPSHGHGQGYADTHFLIPETVSSVDVHKGPYSARFGDFYTAGAMELSTIDKIDGPTLWIAGGVPLGGPRSFGQYNRRLVAMASPEIRDTDTDRSLVAAQIADSDGPFESPQRFRQGNALVKWQGPIGRGDLTLETSWYAARWNASGQIPESAVEQHLITRFGSLDPSEGGDTSRTSVQLGYRVRDDHGGLWHASLFGVRYRLQLFSNFTLFARDPVHGDEIEQDDARWVWGLDTGYERHLSLAGLDSYLAAGVQLRDDSVDNALWHAEDLRALPEASPALAVPPAVAAADIDDLEHLASYASGVVVADIRG